MKIKTSKLTGAALDWAVAKCEGIKTDIPAWADKPWVLCTDDYGVQFVCPKFSTNWTHGGPIIDGNGISPKTSVGWASGMKWQAETDRQEHMQYGPTLLIAAMRCYVASKLGDEVEVPDELA